MSFLNVVAAEGVESSSTDRPSLEEAPLIGRHIGRGRDLNDSVSKWTNSIFIVTAYFMMIHFLLGFCEIILVAPLIKLIEGSLCLSYYNFPGEGIEESQCKGIEIQRSLAKIRGWKSLFDTLPGMLSSLLEGLCTELPSAVSCHSDGKIGRSFWKAENYGPGFNRCGSFAL